MQTWKQIPIPKRMENLPIDIRGFPIPYTVHIDPAGKTDFSKIDVEKHAKCIIDKTCTICGQSLGTDMWFVAGWKVALNPNGAFVDGALHKQCGVYALKVCPYLAVPSYVKQSVNEIPDNAKGVLMLKGKSTMWALLKVAGYNIRIVNDVSVVYMPYRPFVDIEFWNEGVQLSQSQAKSFMK